MENILINPETGREYINVPPKVAAKFLDIAPTMIYSALKQSALPFGFGVQGTGGKWTFCIPCERLKAYRNGFDITFLKEGCVSKR